MPAWSQMKKEELLDVAKSRGLEVSADMTRKQVLDIVREDLGDEPDPEALFVTPEQFSGKTVQVQLPADRDNKAPVKVLVNGKRWDIHRDKPVRVPIEVARVLKNAVETTFRETGRKTETGNVDYEEVNIPRFPMQVVLEDEIAA